MPDKLGVCTAIEKRFAKGLLLVGSSHLPDDHRNVMHAVLALPHSKQRTILSLIMGSVVLRLFIEFGIRYGSVVSSCHDVAVHQTPVGIEARPFKQSIGIREVIDGL